MAHFDPAGEVAPHVQYCINHMRNVADTMIVVSTSDLTPKATAWLRDRVTLLNRPNEGFDFPSYRMGLDAVHLGGYSEVVLMNDGFVFPLSPVDHIFQRMDDVPVDFWGLTQNLQIAPHVQSFFMVFRHTALRAPAFADFWKDVRALPDKDSVILSYEVGLSSQLLAAGLTMSSVFRASRKDRLTATARHAHRLRLLHRTRELIILAKRLLRGRLPAYNPYDALADVSLSSSRMPFVKLSTLRNDPYYLDSEELLRLCESRFPEAFVGVREYLSRTAPFYASPNQRHIRGRRWVRYGRL